MARLSNYLIACLAVIFAVSSLLMIQSTNAQSISEPSVPEFTFRFLENYLHPTIEVTIKNQPYPSTVNDSEAHLYYNLRTKKHMEENWNQQYTISETTLPIQSNSEYTQLTFSPNYPTDNEIDLQVQALLGYYQDITYPESPTLHLSNFITQDSDWSPTQTFTMPTNPTTQPTTSKVYLSENILLVLVAVIAILALALAVSAMVLLKRHI